jgi:hypothetical protein
MWWRLERRCSPFFFDTRGGVVECGEVADHLETPGCHLLPGIQVILGTSMVST